MLIPTCIWALAIGAPQGMPPAAPAVQEQPPLTPGSGKYGKETVSKIDATGPVRLNRTTVNQLHLLGSLSAEDAIIGTLDAIGDVNLSHTIVEQPASIEGYLHSNQSRFLQNLTVVLQRAVLINCHLQGGMTVRENLGFRGKQVLELRQKTIIEGPVVFQSGKGEIHLYSGSKVTGPVTGGKVIRKSN